MNRRLLGVLLASAGPMAAQVPLQRHGDARAVTEHHRAHSYGNPANDDRPPPAAQLGTVSTGRIGEAPDDASPEEKYNWGVPRRNTTATPASRTRDTNRNSDDEGYDGRGAKLRTPGRLTGGRSGDDFDPPPPVPPPPGGSAGDPGWWPGRRRDLDDLRNQFPAFGETDRDRLAFQSDCAFDNFSSPITNPFLAEDPRSLTELHPLYLYQGIPSGQYLYRGGHLSFLGFRTHTRSPIDSRSP